MVKSQTLSLKTAASRIRETRRNIGRRNSSPYFFICGAGISVPSVPLAWEIEKECRQRAEQLDLVSGKAPNKPSETYSFWLEQAYPDPDQRRAYFRTKIEGKPLTDANLRLAHLLADGALSRILITPNFDDFVSRGLHLFGAPHVVCDHPATSARIDLDSNDTQIIHVHGTYWFYDLVNTNAEIQQRASGIYSGPGMSELLADLLRARSPLVLGYSGWEGDVIMSALKKRLQKPLKHQLYWFCFQRKSKETLPTWLVNHPNVCFVLPDEKEPLAADFVFDEFLRTFKVEAPPLTRDPLGFFMTQLRSSLPSKRPGQAPDLYFFDDVLLRIERAAKLAGEGSKKIEEAKEKVRDAVRRGHYALAARRANEITLRRLKTTQLTQLADALWPAVSRGGRNSSEDLRIYEAFLRIVDERPNMSIKSGRLANVLIGRAAVFLRQNHHRKALWAVDDALSRLQGTLEKMPRAYHRLLLTKARALVAQRRYANALAIYEDIANRFGQSVEPRLKIASFRSTREHAALLMKMNQCEQSVELLNALIKRAERSQALQSELHETLRLRAEVYTGMGNVTRAKQDKKRAERVSNTDGL